MSDQRGFISADQFHPDPYTQFRTAERTLNAAIVHADITRSYEEYLEIFDAFYADDVEGSGETTEEPIRGKAGMRSLVFGFLVPLHAMAEVGDVSISVRQTSIPGAVQVTCGQDVAFATAIGRCVSICTGGRREPLEFRLTIGLRKIDGRWRVMHEHHSLPAT
jgi:ketosteroid isomerase-like protein